MPRPQRVDVGDVVYHCINRANARIRIFDTDDDYHVFESVITEAQEQTGVRICAYCVMPNHWHFVLYPNEDGELSRFMGWLTMTHTQRWHVIHNTTGTGHLYQGRYKSFPVQTNEYFLQVCRYVERNALRANLVPKAELWRWSSAWRREYGSEQQKKLLEPWPVAMPENYRAWLHEPQSDGELEALRQSVNRGQPFGNAAWVAQTTEQFGLGATFRKQGRPGGKRNGS